MDFEPFYRDYYPGVARLAFALVGSRAVAEELAQEGFLAAYRGWAAVGGFERPDLWVRRTVINRASNERRRRGRETAALSRFPADRDRVDGGGGIDPALVALVAGLPDRQAQALVLMGLQGLSAAEAGEVMGCSAGSARVALHRARETLKREWGRVGAARRTDDVKGVPDAR